jgi:hypothetical protein
VLRICKELPSFVLIAKNIGQKIPGFQAMSHYASKQDQYGDDSSQDQEDQGWLQGMFLTLLMVQTHANAAAWHRKGSRPQSILMS